MAEEALRVEQEKQKALEAQIQETKRLEEQRRIKEENDKKI